MKSFYFIGFTLACLLFVGLTYGVWQLSRTINYSLSYEDMVQETVCEIVKPEHLKEPEKCK